MSVHSHYRSDDPRPSYNPAPCSECGQGWYATHEGVNYAYPVCACTYQGSAIPSSYPAPEGMDIAASVSDENPGGLVTASLASLIASLSLPYDVKE